jgi:vacuolar-type H+-ATPase subunit H
MDSKAALDKIRQAELQAEETLSEAGAEAGCITEQARQQGAELIKEAQVKAASEAGKLKAQIEQDTAREIEEIKGTSLREVGVLKSKAAENVEKAANFLREKIHI